MVKKSKRSQMKIQQTAFMLIAVTLLFVLAGVFFLGFKLSGLKKQALSLEENNALLLVSKLANSPEFSCENAFGTKRTNCVDEDKVMALKNNEGYAGFWGKSNIEIRKIGSSEKECTIANYPDCDVIKIADGKQGGAYVGNFVALCRKANVNGYIEDKCEVAKLLVSYGVQNG
ncbi:MAG: hypothetical protein AABW51_00270 [Nanoarchaeota archaeon]